MAAIASGGDLTQVDRFGLTTLHHAAICGHVEIVGYILLGSKLALNFQRIVENNQSDDSITVR